MNYQQRVWDKNLLCKGVMEKNYRNDIFGIYRFRGVRPRVHDYCHGLITDREVLLRLGTQLRLIKKFRDEFKRLPPDYNIWPSSFFMQCTGNFRVPNDEIIHYLERCIQRRIQFKKENKWPPYFHDNFLLMLQYCRALLMIYDPDFYHTKTPS